MGLLKDFKEFLAMKKGKTYQTDTLYYGRLGQADVYEKGDYVCAEIHKQKYVILQKANPKELKSYMKGKYGTYCGELWTPAVPEFAKTENTDYYKVLTMGNLFVPVTTSKILCQDYDNRGHHTVVTDVQHLQSIYQNGVGMRLGETISHDDVIELENIINIAATTPNRSM